MARYLAAYDVSDDRQRTQVANVLSEFGFRLQWSVFEIDIDPEDLPVIRRRIGALLSPTDRFDLVPVDLRPDRHRITLATIHNDSPPGSDVRVGARVIRLLAAHCT